MTEVALVSIIEYLCSELWTYRLCLILLNYASDCLIAQYDGVTHHEIVLAYPFHICEIHTPEALGERL